MAENEAADEHESLKRKNCKNEYIKSDTKMWKSLYGRVIGSNYSHKSRRKQGSYERNRSNRDRREKREYPRKSREDSIDD